MHTNPAYNQRQSDSGDIAVITFASPLLGITLAGLPAAGVFDEMARKGGLRGQRFTAVGYGVDALRAPSGGQHADLRCHRQPQGDVLAVAGIDHHHAG